LDSGTARRFEGTGLGLALTKKIIEFQGGQIAVESGLGKGSTFSVTLPIVSKKINL
jgi:signal transduction histidine kinase